MTSLSDDVTGRNRAEYPRAAIRTGAIPSAEKLAVESPTINVCYQFLCAVEAAGIAAYRRTVGMPLPRWAEVITQSRLRKRGITGFVEET